MAEEPSEEVTRQDACVLIVEDSPTQAEHLQYLLERNGFQVAVATNGRQAMELLDKLNVAMVISDIVMPEMSGYDLCSAIRADPRHAALPVMLVTSLVDVQDVLRGLECGADNFIRKPYDEKYLLSRVDYLLMNHEMRQNRKMQVGLEIYLSGQKHFVNAERQQILDLLISTFEEAVRVKEDLEVRQQEIMIAALYERTHGDVLRLFNSTLEREKLLKGMLETLSRNHAYPFSAVYHFDEWNGLYRQEARHNASGMPLAELLLPDDLLREVAREQRTRVLRDFDPTHLFGPEGAAKTIRPSVIVLCPALHFDKLLAILVVVSSRPLSDRDLTFLERIAAQLGVALNNVRQYDDLRLLAQQLRMRSEEINRQNMQLEEANRMKSEFLANMSHELRTPLNAIIGFSEVMRDGLVGEISEQQREYINDIFESGQHLLYLINDVLDLSKIEAGKMMLEAEETDVAALLHGSLSIIRERALAHRIHLLIDAPENLGTAWLDPRKVKQIIYNLLSNAVKFTPENGSVTLTASRRSREEVTAHTDTRPEMHSGFTSEAAEFIEIAVTDTGIGIAETDLARLFQPFVQLDSSLSRRFDGTGLGLVMVKKLIDLHGGAVSVASVQDQGSTFTVWLPYREAPSFAAAEPDIVMAAHPSAAQSPLVLIIEDEYRAADLIRLQLERAGCRTTSAPSAEIALEMLRGDCKPDLITLDILLPGMDGWDFLSRLKLEATLAHIPVVIVSIVADGSKGLALGAADVLQKPITADELLAALGKLGFVQPGGKATVLVVDDDPRSVEIIAAYLEKGGYNVLRTYSGGEGLQVAQSHLPDLIVLDLMMPEVSGFDIVETLKASSRTSGIPLVVLTAKHLSAEDRQMLHGQVLQIVEKSEFNPGEFIGEVRRALGRAWQKS
jgi:signal transduction histidine kinase/DNA-binding response OmpR family regulator